MRSEFQKSKIFEYRDYKKYLVDVFDSMANAPRSGKRSAFSKALGCQPAYLSRVLNGDAHLSLEQADKASVFLAHPAPEERYFFFLVVLNRAGTSSLRNKITAELEEMREKHLLLKNRVPLRQPLPLERQVIYYSAWYYTAIHMLFDIDVRWTPELISKTLELPVKRVQEVLSFLTENGLLKLTNTGYEILERETHVDSESPLVAKHHINWRMKAIQNLEKANKESLHYSSVISISRKDVAQIRDIMVGAIAEIRKVAKEADPEEVLYSYCLDLFPVSEKPA